MTDSDKSDDRPPAGRKIRVPFRRNRTKPARVKDWTRLARDAEDGDIETLGSERVSAKGALSRHRTVIVDAQPSEQSRRGVVIALRGQFCEVDDGQRIWQCTVRRVLRTRFSLNRNPLATGDIVNFSAIGPTDGPKYHGVVESVEDRKGQLRRKVGRRIQTIVANVDQVIIVSSAADPPPKPHLIDRYIVATLAGAMVPVVCMNKMDLLAESGKILEGYQRLGYQTLATCAVKPGGVEALGKILPNRASAVVGQSGVGKTALLNAIQPGLGLAVRTVAPDTRKGRHTTSTATLIRLDGGGYIVDTPGVRSLDLSTVPRCDLEKFFVEFAEPIARCKFADCTHTHEIGCAVKEAVEDGLISTKRYESYARMFQERS